MPNPKGERFSGLYDRLVRNTVLAPGAIESSACWLWTGGSYKGYPEMNVRHMGVHFTIKPHRAMLCILDCCGETEHFFDLYKLYGVAELDADHLCFNSPLCINHDHLQWLTKEEHERKNRTEKHPDATHEGPTRAANGWWLPRRPAVHSGEASGSEVFNQIQRAVEILEAQASGMGRPQGAAPDQAPSEGAEEEDRASLV